MIKTCVAQGAMRSGAARPHMGCMQGNILLYIWRHNFLSPSYTTSQGSFSYSSENSVQDRLFICFIVFFFPAGLFVSLKKKQIKFQKLPITFFPQKTQLDKGHFSIPWKFLYKLIIYFIVIFSSKSIFFLKIYWTNSVKSDFKCNYTMKIFCEKKKQIRVTLKINSNTR